MKSKFNIGDIVVTCGKSCASYDQYTLPIGIKGKVVHVSSWERIGVEWEYQLASLFSEYDLSDNHDCKGHGKDGYCWYVDEDTIKLEE